MQKAEFVALVWSVARFDYGFAQAASLLCVGVYPLHPHALLPPPFPTVIQKHSQVVTESLFFLHVFLQNAYHFVHTDLSFTEAVLC